VQWLDVFGPPGVGKSTLCDEDWPPDAIKPDGFGYPDEWAAFVKLTNRLLGTVSGHPSYGACESMVRRSFRKMATVHRIKSDRVYVQTGFAQRGLGLGWRMKDQREVAAYFEAMPVSLGVASLHADIATVQRRNVERGKDRAFMVPLIEKPRRLGVEVLKARGVPVLELDMLEPIEANKARLRDFVQCLRS
jgi:hypothetical protein